MPRRHKNPVTVFTIPALILAVGLTVGLKHWAGGPVWFWWLVAINIVAFGAYGWDKRSAEAGGLRTPEIVLLGLVLVGGTVGAYLGMRRFRHKTKKPSFRVLFWLIVVLQVALACWHFIR